MRCDQYDGGGGRTEEHSHSSQQLHVDHTPTNLALRTLDLHPLPRMSVRESFSCAETMVKEEFGCVGGFGAREMCES